jgi:hypothetical protein
MSNEKEYITYLWHSYEVDSIQAYGLNRDASIIHAYFKYEVGVSGQLLAYPERKKPWYPVNRGLSDPWRQSVSEVCPESIRPC